MSETTTHQNMDEKAADIPKFERNMTLVQYGTNTYILYEHQLSESEIITTLVDVNKIRHIGMGMDKAGASWVKVVMVEGATAVALECKDYDSASKNYSRIKHLLCSHFGNSITLLD